MSFEFLQSTFGFHEKEKLLSMMLNFSLETLLPRCSHLNFGMHSLYVNVCRIIFYPRTNWKTQFDNHILWSSASHVHILSIFLFRKVLYHHDKRDYKIFRWRHNINCFLEFLSHQQEKHKVFRKTFLRSFTFVSV